jgi:tetratricopeptide (TPR) repeat protein
MRSGLSARILLIALTFAAAAVSRPAAADDQQTCLEGSKHAIAETIAACTRAIESGDYSEQELAALYHARGYSWSSTSFTDRTDRALKDYSAAIRANPNSGGSLLNRAHIYNQWHDYDRAIADVNQAFKAGLAGYGKQVAFGERGYAYQLKGDNDRAIADYTAGIELNANNYVAFTSRCSAYFAKGDLDRAIADCSQAIALRPNYKDAYFDRGQAYDGKGELDHAIADYDRAIALDPNYWQVYGRRAIAHLHRGEFRAAIADFTLWQLLFGLGGIVLVVALVWICCRSDSPAPGLSRRVIEICERELAELQNRNAVLEKIAMALERRSSG